MKLLSLFSGIGAFEKALNRLKIDYELIGYCEIDKYASKSYAAIHGVPESMNIGDITKVDEQALPKDIDLISYGFPCQDISLAGKQKGLFNEDGSKTRSGLFFEALRIIETTQPRLAVAENVKNLTGKKFKDQFEIVLGSLEQAGYNNYWKVLNAKDYGIPQNRERVFVVSIRKDVDTGFFQFPEGFPLELRLKDLLEGEVDEKYYLSGKMKKYLFDTTEKNKARANGNMYKACDVNGISNTITTKEEQGVISNFIEEPSVLQIGNCCPTKTRDNPNQGRIYDTEGLAPCLNQMSGGNRQPFITVTEATKKGYAKAFEGDSINLEQPNSKTRRDRVGNQVAQTLTTSCNQAVLVSKITDGIANTLTTVSKDNYVVEPFIAASRGRNPENPSDRTVGTPTVQRLEPNSQGICNTLTTVQKDNYVCEPQGYELKIRKLTPRECFRLMDFDDEDFEKAEAVNSDTQLYKQAGNSIVVACLYHIFKALIEANILIKKESKEMELRVNEVSIPEQITFNYDELKQELTEKMAFYETLAYTDEQVKDAKADRASLNKLKKALNDERLRQEREYMKPFNTFKAQINEIIGIIDKPVALIDKQVKDFEEKKKQEKLEAIKELYKSLGAQTFLTLEKIWDDKWLNSSTSMKSIETAIKERIYKASNDLLTLSKLPEFGFEATELYKETLDINKAIAEAQRLSEIAKKKAEHETEMKAREEAKRQAEEMAKAMHPPVEEHNPDQMEFTDVESFDSIVEEVKQPEPQKQWVSFAALLSTDDALALKDFFNSRNIEFKAV